MIFQLSLAEKSFLGRLACLSIESALEGKPLEQPPSFEGGPASILHKNLGAFVTLTRNGQLRGCIGSIVGREPLLQNVWRMARAAAFEDPRFPALRQEEWPHIQMEISILGELTLCPNPDDIEIGRHGLVLTYRGQSGVFLPQVPVEQGWDRHAYLEHLCRKAGVAQGSWKKPDARLYWYEALHFPVER